jgi:putative FmdB family regulatory protein
MERLLLLGMPIYEFRCHACDLHFEELVEVGGLAPCPKCGRIPIRKISGFVVLRGTQQQSVEPSQSKSRVNLSDVQIKGCSTGIRMGAGVHVKARGLVIEDTKLGIDNQGGIFDGPDTKFS